MGGVPWRKGTLTKLTPLAATLKAGSACFFSSVLHWGWDLCLHWLVSPTEHNTLSHYMYMPAVLHNWIKREATVPQNKKAVRLMRTHSGSERCRVVPVSISSLFILWVTPKNTDLLLCIKCFKGQISSIVGCHFLCVFVSRDANE